MHSNPHTYTLAHSTHPHTKTNITSDDLSLTHTNIKSSHYMCGFAFCGRSPKCACANRFMAPLWVTHTHTQIERLPPPSDLPLVPLIIGVAQAKSGLISALTALIDGTEKSGTFQLPPCLVFIVCYFFVFFKRRWFSFCYCTFIHLSICRITSTFRNECYRLETT